jgi:hypothetical protein
MSVEQIEGLTLRERDQRIAALRARLFGDELDCYTTCPTCAEEIEFTLTASSLIPDPVSGDHTGTVRAGGYQVWCHPPTIGDLLRCLELPSSEREDALLSRCIDRCEAAGNEVAGNELPPAARQAVADHLSALHDGSTTDLTFSCPMCRNQSSVPFDIASYLSTELDEWADDALWEVHALAWAYGWNEAEILGLSQWRRRRYLELIGA